MFFWLNLNIFIFLSHLRPIFFCLTLPSNYFSSVSPPVYFSTSVYSNSGGSYCFVAYRHPLTNAPLGPVAAAFISSPYSLHFRVAFLLSCHRQIPPSDNFFPRHHILVFPPPLISLSFQLAIFSLPIKIFLLFF